MSENLGSFPEEKGPGRDVDQLSPTRAYVESDWSYASAPPTRLYTFCLPQDGTTPLILAAASGHVDCVKELLNQGADPRARRVVSVSILHVQLNFLNKIGSGFSRIYRNSSVDGRAFVTDPPASMALSSLQWLAVGTKTQTEPNCMCICKAVCQLVRVYRMC